MAAEEQRSEFLGLTRRNGARTSCRYQSTSVRWPHFSIIEPLPFVVGFREHAQRQRQIAR